jgi:hypothetical protein
MPQPTPVSSDHPSAESLLGEYIVLSLDQRRHDKDGLTLLRVKADSEEVNLRQMIQCIKVAAPNVEILKYGLHG